MYARGHRAVTCPTWKHSRYLPGGTTQIYLTTRKPNTTIGPVYVSASLMIVTACLPQVARAASSPARSFLVLATSPKLADQHRLSILELLAAVAGLASLIGPRVPIGLRVHGLL